MPDEATLEGLGLLGLFLASLLAGSVLPFPSEGVLVGLIQGGVAALSAVLVATCGNVLGAVTVYGMGWAVNRGLFKERLRRRFEGDPEALVRARSRIERWGAWVLLLSWVPIVGDTFVLGAGLVRLRFWVFLLLVTVGKTGRYVAVAWVVAGR